MTRRTMLALGAVVLLASATAAKAAQQDPPAGAKAQPEAKLIDELRAPVCAALGRWRRRLPDPLVVQVTGTGDAIEVDLVGLSGHASIFSVDAVCPNCADRMLTYHDATGARFCDVGVIAGKMCDEMKPFPRTATVHRTGSADALWKEFGCR
jgi:hypothetical protein